MVLRLKLKYKFLYAVIFTSVIFLTSLLTTISLSSKKECEEQEPIDVVYTWVNGSDELFKQQLAEYLQQNKSWRTDVSTSRYTDRHELKFSLRSLEQYAPWIRNVYIVTNGQIPYWLNLDYERAFLVTHEDIFTNLNDLPTFSSPAIEMHLHRIPGISRRFLYFNDDIYLGAPVFIEDFFSPSRGFLIYFSHPLHSCAKDCPWLYVQDGQCDRECNNSDCQMDGGDCEEGDKNRSLNVLAVWDEPTFNLNTTIATNLNSSKSPVDEVNFEVMFSKLSNNADIDLENVVGQHNRKVLLRNRVRRQKKENNISKRFQHRQLEATSINAYMESLQHTNRLFNLRYRFMPRHVPAHMPFLIDVDIMNAFQDRFQEEVTVTSANKVRRGNDLQFAFAHYYFIFHERINLTVEEIFDLFDTDKSGTWSDREIRTILTKLYKLPLSYSDVEEFDSILINCTKTGTFQEMTTPEYERYVDSKLPTITKEIVSYCPKLRKMLQKFGSKPKYKYEVVADVSKYVSFQMLTANAPDTIKKLDGLRQNPKKFVCLNDNLNNESGSGIVNALWYDFYVSIFPNPSKFELPQEYRNKFLYVKDLRSYHFRLKLYIYFCIVFLSYATACVLCRRKIAYLIRNKLFR